MKQEREFRRELMPGDPWDAGATEQWLQDRAAEGWSLEELGFRVARFRRTEPRRTRFRCEPVESRWGHPAPEQEALYAETGWYYAGLRNPGYGWYRVWRCDDPAAPELRTDPETEKYAYRWQLRRSVRRVLWPWLVLLAVLAWVAWRWQSAGSPVEHFLYRMGPGNLLTALLIPMALWDTWRELRCIRHLRRMVTAGLPLPHSGNWRKNRRRERWELGLLSVWWALLLVYPFWQVHAGRAAEEQAERELPCVSCRTLRPEDSLRTQSVLANVYFLVPRCYETRQEAGDGAYVSAQLDILRFRCLAEPLWRERTDRLRERWEPETAEVLEDPRFDGAVLLAGEERQCLSVRRGRAVLTEWSGCGVDLRDYLDDFAAVLGRYE